MVLNDLDKEKQEEIGLWSFLLHYRSILTVRVRLLFIYQFKHYSVKSKPGLRTAERMSLGVIFCTQGSEKVHGEREDTRHGVTV